MKRILALLAGGLLIGAFSASHAKLPSAPPKSDAENAGRGAEAAAAKAKAAYELGKAEDKAVANYRKNRGASVSTKKN